MNAKEFLKAENNWEEKDTGLFDRNSLADLLEKYVQQSNRLDGVVIKGDSQPVPNGGIDKLEPNTSEFENFLLINALRNLDTKRRHNLLAALIERDTALQETMSAFLKNMTYKY